MAREKLTLVKAGEVLGCHHMTLFKWMNDPCVEPLPPYREKLDKTLKASERKADIS